MPNRRCFCGGRPGMQCRLSRQTQSHLKKNRHPQWKPFHLRRPRSWPVWVLGRSWGLNNLLQGQKWCRQGPLIINIIVDNVVEPKTSWLRHLGLTSR